MKTEPINSHNRSHKLRNTTAAITAGTILLIPSHATSADYFEKTPDRVAIVQQIEDNSTKNQHQNTTSKTAGACLCTAAILSALAGIGITTKSLFKRIDGLEKENSRLKDDNVIKNLEIKRLERENEILSTRLKRLTRKQESIEEKRKRVIGVI